MQLTSELIKLQAQLRALQFAPGQIKDAELGGSQDTPFESAFSNLAHAYLKDKAPNLQEFEIGFQLIEKNQENTKAVGVLGFKVGSQWVYVPVFFLNGDLKGHELMYLKNQDHFVPLDERWVDHILGKKPATLGDGVNRNLSQLGIMPPNLYQLSRSPQKFASDKGYDPSLPKDPDILPTATWVTRNPAPVTKQAANEGVFKHTRKIEPTKFTKTSAARGAYEPMLSSWGKDALGAMAYIAYTPLTKMAEHQDLYVLPRFLKEAGEPMFRFFLEKVGTQYPDLIQYTMDLYPGMLQEVAEHIVAEKRAAADPRTLTKFAATSCAGDKLPTSWNGSMKRPNKGDGSIGSYGEEAWKSADAYRPSKGDKADLSRSAHLKDAAAVGKPKPEPVSIQNMRKPKKGRIFKKRGEASGVTPSLIGPMESLPEGIEHKVISKDQVMSDPNIAHSLSELERKTLLKQRVIYRDTRDKKDVTIAYNVQTELKLYNPDHTGIYQVLTKPDDFEKCLVIFGPYNHKKRQTFVTVVRLEGKKNFVNTHPMNVWCRAELDTQSWKKWLDEQPTLKSVPLQRKKKSKYDDEMRSDYSDTRRFIALSPDGQASVPFKATESYTAGDDRGTLYDVDFDSYASGPRPGHLKDHSRYDHDPYWGEGPFCGHSSHVEQLAVCKTPGTKLMANFGQLHVPDDGHLIQVKDESGPGESDSEPLRLFGLGQLQALIMSHTSPLRIVSDGKDITVNEQRKDGEKDAVAHLFLDYGLSKDAAEAIVEQARHARHLELRLIFPENVKYAADKRATGSDNDSNDMIRGAPNAPPFPEPYMGYDPMTGGNVPTMQESEFNFKIPDMSASKTDRSIYHPFGPDPQAMQTAQNAAKGGQKEVFDTAMLSGLLKAMRQDTMVDKYMGDLMKGLDRLGRILFQYYWHGEEFEDRYGKQDMPELEDGIRNAFEGLGDIILALKQKGVDVPMDNGNVDLGPLANQ